MVRGAVQDEGESSPERDGFDGLVDAVIDGLQQLLLFLCQGSLRTEVLLAQFGCLLFFGDDGVLALCALGVLLAAPLSERAAAEDPAVEKVADAERAALEKRYGPLFYGVELPENGARVLLVVDTSKSMGRKDATRTDGGRRWDTLLDEVAKMADSMRALIRARRVCFTVSVLYEGGDTPHGGTEPFDMAQTGASERLLEELRGRDFTTGGSFETTFGETLWPLVSRQHITYVFYLGDNDIGRYAEAPVRDAVSAWYALPRKEPAADQRKLWNLKVAWWKPWANWRRPARGVPTFRSRQTFPLPPPPRDVVFSCIAIGQKSPLLKELAKLGHGEYVERVPSRRKD